MSAVTRVYWHVLLTEKINILPSYRRSKIYKTDKMSASMSKSVFKDPVTTITIVRKTLLGAMHSVNLNSVKHVIFARPRPSISTNGKVDASLWRENCSQKKRPVL